jgi:ankyrin repeat protein
MRSSLLRTAALVAIGGAVVGWTLLARNLSADRYYADQDCMVYTTGRLDAPRVTYAACGIMDIIDPATSGGSIERRLAVLHSLIAHGANVNAGDRHGVTPLMFACSRDEPSFIQPLIDAGAVVNAADDLGRTPLMIAAESFRNQVIKVGMLLDAGADVTMRDVTMRDTEGHTAAERVRTSSDAELLSLLNAQ